MIFAIPGGMKKTSIEKILISITMDMIGPSIISVNEKGRVLSSNPKSLENVLSSLPEGVTSKNFVGDLTNPYIIF